MSSTTHYTYDSSDLLPILQGIGFSRNEAAVYLSVVELGPSSIWQIAKKSGLKRPTCYSLLEELILKGHAASVNDGKRAIYSVTSPRRLLLATETRYSRFSAAITEFDALASRSPQKPSVRLYEGEEGVKAVYELSLEMAKGSEVLVYSSDSLLSAGYGDFLDGYIIRRVSRGVGVRLLYADTPENRALGQADPKKLRSSRFLPPDSFNPTIEMQIMGESIAYVAHSEKDPFATVLENAAVAREERQRFELLWGIGKE